MELYRPFLDLDFARDRCYLCGSRVPAENVLKTVFPIWFMDSFELTNQPFRLLNEKIVSYEDLLVPSCIQCNGLMEPLENAVSAGFTGGYAEMIQMDPLITFKWVSRILYGIIYVEIQEAINDHALEINKGVGGNEPLGISPSLLTKFSTVHLLLQSIRVPMVFENFTPFSCLIFDVSGGSQRPPFEYRDDMSTLIFSLTARDFGLILCLQDNGYNERYHAKLLGQWKNKSLTFQQFQEMRARLFYSAYLFSPIPDYLVLPKVPGSQEFTVIAEPLPFGGMKAMFRPWNNEIYAQVLEAFWKPWHVTKSKILKDPARPLSFLEPMHSTNEESLERD